jgi:lipopolysaccharide export system protein LptA
MTTTRILGACLGAAIFAAPALAQQAMAIGKHDANAPIQVSADNFLADINAKTGTYSGNVVVTQGDFRLRADKVRVNVVQGKPDQIFAMGNVLFDAPSGAARGDNGVYNVGPRLITLTGHVVLTKEKNVMRGSTLTVNLVTGTAQLGNSGGRVQGLFQPPPQQQSSTQKP